MITRGFFRRNTGAIDSSIAEAVPLPIVPDWVTGRFYSGFSSASQALGTRGIGVIAYAVPIVVPRPIVATAIGVEVTTAGGAGSLLRFAIYEDDGSSYPGQLLLDAGTVASDATGFQSIAISQVLQATIYWLAIAHKQVTSDTTVRAFQTLSAHCISTANVTNDSATAAVSVSVNNNPAISGIVDCGWWRQFVKGSNNMNYENGINTPRIMLGV